MQPGLLCLGGVPVWGFPGEKQGHSQWGADKCAEKQQGEIVIRFYLLLVIRPSWLVSLCCGQSKKYIQCNFMSAHITCQEHFCVVSLKTHTLELLNHNYWRKYTHFSILDLKHCHLLFNDNFVFWCIDVWKRVFSVWFTTEAVWGWWKGNKF